MGRGREMNSFPLPRYVQLYPTNRCNQSCAFCFNDRTSPVRDLSPQDALNLLDILCNLGIRDLDIMGGEPFLLPWMPSFLHAAMKEDILVNISTNGSTPDVFGEFRGVSPEKINIGISLEGSTADAHNRLTHSDNYDKAISSIASLVSCELGPIVKTVVSRLNMQDIQPIIDLLKDLGVNRYYLIQMDLFSREPLDRINAPGFVEFRRFCDAVIERNSGIRIDKVNASCFEKDILPKGVRCAGGVRKLSVMPDGSVYPCNLFQSMPEFNLGNVFVDDFTDIWNHPALLFFRRAVHNECGKECVNHHNCTGGCPAHGIFHSQDNKVGDIRCLQDAAL